MLCSTYGQPIYSQNEESQSRPWQSLRNTPFMLSSLGLRALLIIVIFCLGSQSPSLAATSSESERSDDNVREMSLQFQQHPVLQQIAAQANKIKASKTSYLCWKVVHNNHLQPLGLVDHRNNPQKFYATKARDADRELQDQGFINLMEPGQIYEHINDICSLPAGVVLVYTSSVPNHPYGDYGHIEIKTGKIGSGEVSSDFRSPRPVTGSCNTKSKTFALKAILIPQKVPVAFW